MNVYGEEASQVEVSEKARSSSMQTEPVASLPCSSCLKEDVGLHPLVQMQMVNLELAQALFGQVPGKSTDEKDANSSTSRKSKKRDYILKGNG